MIRYHSVNARSTGTCCSWCCCPTAWFCPGHSGLCAAGCNGVSNGCSCADGGWVLRMHERFIAPFREQWEACIFIYCFCILCSFVPIVGTFWCDPRILLCTFWSFWAWFLDEIYITCYFPSVNSAMCRSRLPRFQCQQAGLMSAGRWLAGDFVRHSWLAMQQLLDMSGGLR